MSPRTAWDCPLSPRRGLASPLASDTEEVPPTSCPAPPPLPSHPPAQRGTAGCTLYQSWRILNKMPVPPSPLGPHHVQLAWGGRKKFHTTQEAARPSPSLQHRAPPKGPRTHRGLPAPHGAPPHPQSRRLPRTTHLWAQRTKNKTQTTTQSSNPPTPQVKVKAEKPKKHQKHHKKSPAKGKRGGQEGNAAPLSSPARPQPAFLCYDYF